MMRRRRYRPQPKRDTRRDLRPGQRFGKWTVIRKTASRAVNGAVLYAVKCDCGTDAEVAGGRLKSGHSRQCSGCAREVARIAPHKKLTDETIARVVSARSSGCTFAEIGKALGFSRQRAQQIAKKAEVVK